MPDDIKAVKENWILGLMQKGLIIQLSIKRWRATAKLTPDDLGIKFIDNDSFDFSKRYLNLGRQLLLPPEVLKDFVNLEQNGRALLRNMSFETPWGCFVPDTALDEWERQNNEIRKDFMSSARMFGDRYEEIIDMVRKDYKIFARDVWARLYPENKDGATDSFIEHFAQRAVEKIPPRGDIVSSFSYNYVCFEIPMPSFVQADVLKANELKRADDLAEEDVVIQKDTKRRLAQVYIEKKEVFLDGFLEATAEQFRNEIGKLCLAVLESIGKNKKKNGDITEGQKNKIKDMLDKVKQLNFYNDKVINDLMFDLEKEIRKIKGEENADIIADRLNKIIKKSSEELDPEDFNPTIDHLEF